jgi:hypothetical protein
MNLSLNNLDESSKYIYIKVRLLDGQTEDYGPFNLFDLKRLFTEERVDGHTFVYTIEMENWKVLADFADYQKVFGEEPPEISAMERRVLTRKSFNSKATLIRGEERFPAITYDLSMLAIKISTTFDGLSEDDDVSLVIDHFGEEFQFRAKVMRLFDSSGEENFLTLKFSELSLDLKDKLSHLIHFNELPTSADS